MILRSQKFMIAPEDMLGQTDTPESGTGHERATNATMIAEASPGAGELRYKLKRRNQMLHANAVGAKIAKKAKPAVKKIPPLPAERKSDHSENDGHGLHRP